MELATRGGIRMVKTVDKAGYFLPRLPHGTMAATVRSEMCIALLQRSNFGRVGSIRPGSEGSENPALTKLIVAFLALIF